MSGSLAVAQLEDSPVLPARVVLGLSAAFLLGVVGTATHRRTRRRTVDATGGTPLAESSPRYGVRVQALLQKLHLSPSHMEGACGMRIGQSTELSPAVPYLSSSSQVLSVERTFQYHPVPVTVSAEAGAPNIAVSW